MALLAAAGGCAVPTKGDLGKQRAAAATQPTIMPALIPPDGLNADMAHLFETIEQTHINPYAFTSKADFARLRKAAMARIGQPMTREQLYWVAAPLVASLKNGHTFVYPPTERLKRHLAKGGRYCPLELDCDGRKALLAGYPHLEKRLVGATVLSINGADAGRALRRYARCFPAEGKAANYPVLRRLLPAMLWLDRGAEPVKLRVKTADGKIRAVTLSPVTKEQAEAGATVAGSRAKRYTFRYLADRGVGLIEFNSFSGRKAFGKFLQETFTTLRDKKAAGLVIDLRRNPGGNSALGDMLLGYLTDKPFAQFSQFQVKVSALLRKQQAPMVKVARQLSEGAEPRDGQVFSHRLPEKKPADNPLRFGGNVCVLISRATSSAAVSLASTVKHYKLATVIGRETGDATSSYGDSLSFTLPNSKLRVGVACKHFVCAGSAEDGRGVLPDHEVAQSPADAAKGVDTALQFTLDLIAKSSGE